MLKLIKFFESKCLESKIYWRVPTLYQETEFEIEWHRDRRKKWHIRENKEDQQWQVCSTDELLELLNKEKIDIHAFEKKLTVSFLQQIVFAKMLYDEALEFFGEKTVDQAVKETEEFLEKLKSMVLNILETKKQSDEDQELELESKAKIKLVKK